MNGKLFTTLYLGLILSFFLSPLSAGAVGQVTEPIVIDEAVRGEVFESRLTLLNPGDREKTYTLDTQGDIEDWASFFSLSDLDEPITEIKVPAQTYLDVLVLFLVPEDTPNGDYSGLINVKAKKEEGAEEQLIAVSPSVGREVSITVSDIEIIDFQVSLIPKSYDLEKGGSLPVRVVYTNQGNVSIRPLAEIEISQKGEVLQRTLYPYPDHLDPIRPLSQKEIPLLHLPVYDLEAGKYLANLSFRINDEEHAEEGFSFSVKTESSSSPVWGAWVGSLGSGEIGVHLVIFLIFVFLLFLFFIKHRGREEKID